MFIFYEKCTYKSWLTSWFAFSSALSLVIIELIQYIDSKYLHTIINQFPYLYLYFKLIQSL